MQWNINLKGTDKMTKALLVSSIEEGTETFVKRHIELLGEHVMVIYGGLTPYKTSCTDESNSIILKIIFKVLFLFRKKITFREFLLSRILKKKNIEICYAEFGPVGVGALNSCKANNVELIVNFHGYDAFRYDILEEYGQSYQRLFDYCKYVVVVSHSMKNQIEMLGCTANKIKLIPCYPDPKFFDIEYRPSQKNITFIGRFVEKKSPHLLVLAFTQVVAKFPEANLYLVGDGPLKPICEGIVSSLGIKNVSFKGMLGHEEVRSILSETMVYAQHSVCASNGDREGTPVSVMESLSAGIPIVSTKHEGIMDIIDTSSVGLLVDENDVNQMAENICTLISDEDLRLKISKEAKKRAKKLFFENTSDMHFLELFDS